MNALLMIQCYCQAQQQSGEFEWDIERGEWCYESEEARFFIQVGDEGFTLQVFNGDSETELAIEKVSQLKKWLFDTDWSHLDSEERLAA
ncbi:MAG: hypothetical protein NVS2B14_00600 [Chamaesiphon sp.]